MTPENLAKMKQLAATISRFGRGHKSTAAALMQRAIDMGEGNGRCG